MTTPVVTALTCGAAGGRKLSGDPCRAFLNLSPTSGLCMMHDPERVAQRLLMQRRGASNSAVSKRRARAADPSIVPRPPQTLDEAVEWSSWAMHSVAAGELDARTGHEIGYLIARFTEALNKRDLLREVEQLRRDLAAARAQSPENRRRGTVHD